MPFGWQDGPAGFVFHGMGAPYCPWREWEDNLKEAVFAGRDSGKSWAGAARHLLYVQAWPKSLNLIAAPDYTTLERGTFPAFEQVLGENGFVRGVHYDYNITHHEITYWNGSKAYLVSLDDKRAGRSIRASSIWLDEPGDVEWEAFQSLIPTLTRPGFPHLLWMTGTTVGKEHWSYQYFFPREAFEEGYSQIDVRSLIVSETGSQADRRHVVEMQGLRGEPAGRRVALRATTRENPHGGLQADIEMQALHGKDSPSYLQESEGWFVVQADLTYPMWNTDYHAKKREAWPEGTRDPKWRPDNVALGVDFGSTPGHKSAIVVKGVDHLGRWFTLESWKAPSTPADLAERAVELAEKWGASYCFSDWDPAWRLPLRDALLDVGVYCDRANKFFGRLNDPSGGIGTVAFVLNKRLPDGSQACFVDRETCWDLVREYENYHRMPDSQSTPGAKKPPVQIGDDDMDADRYVTVGIVNYLHWDAPGWDSGPKVFETRLIGVS